MFPKIILASSSRFRRSLLMNAGLSFDVLPATIDERAIEGPLEENGVLPEEMALILAKAKAIDVSRRMPASLVIGSDQTMSLGRRVYHKPKTMDEARDHLFSLSGKTHQLNSAVVLALGSEIVWHHVATARLHVRNLDGGFIDRHLAKVGERALESVGAYQIEGEGIQLFEAVDGDHFTIIGLPLLPLLSALRERGVIDA